ncbi:hypothetical protein [Nocardia asiatica]|uniref:hypothetical protein n=1 Tax=Nocardia asiatica TaxID=209252 RepID=UPI0002E24EF1|nr:hypothetical protein [Nocardia asiatica]
MNREEFAAAVDLDGEILNEAHEAFTVELRAPRKSLAGRSADLAQSLRLIGVDEGAIYSAVTLLATERRR